MAIPRCLMTQLIELKAKLDSRRYVFMITNREE